MGDPRAPDAPDPSPPGTSDNLVLSKIYYRVRRETAHPCQLDPLRSRARGYSQRRCAAIEDSLAMPKRTDIKSILIIGAGPIVIGQACEFDYSGTQACKALRAEGYRIILVNSNPATIMTDPELADATYIEPITPEVVAKIIAKEKPDAVLPTMGGQTALNTALALEHMGVLKQHGVELIGAKAEAIDKAEDRKLFREAMDRIGLESPRAAIASSPPIKDANGIVTGYDRAAGFLEAMRVLDAPARFRDLGMAGVELVRDRYSLKVCLPQVLGVYQAAAQGRATKTARPGP